MNEVRYIAIDNRKILKSEIQDLKIARKKRLLLFIQRIIGVIIIIGTILLCNSPLMYEAEIDSNDWTMALITIPVGLILIFNRKCWLFCAEDRN